MRFKWLLGAAVTVPAWASSWNTTVDVVPQGQECLVLEGFVVEKTSRRVLNDVPVTVVWFELERARVGSADRRFGVVVPGGWLPNGDYLIAAGAPTFDVGERYLVAGSRWPLDSAVLMLNEWPASVFHEQEGGVVGEGGTVTGWTDFGRPVFGPTACESILVNARDRTPVDTDEPVDGSAFDWEASTYCRGIFEGLSWDAVGDSVAQHYAERGSPASLVAPLEVP